MRVLDFGTISGKEKLKKEIHTAKEKLRRQKSKLFWINWFPLKLVFQNKIESMKQAVEETNGALRKHEREYDKHKLGLEISLPERLEAAFGTLDDRFSEVINAEKVWDVTTSQSIDRVAERTTADNAIERTEVCLRRAHNSKIQCDYKALHLENANGGDLHIYPQFFFIEKEDDFALIDLLDVDMDFTLTNFIESESVPIDSEVIDHTWAMSNKDGSRDKRYADNYEIPVVQYGKLHLSSKSGLNEVYMVSNSESAYCFKIMFDEYKEILASSATCKV